VKEQWIEERLFDVEDVAPVPKHASRRSLPMQRLWTESKAQLIERYLFRFLMVTKDGTYIDGFAGPQDEQHLETWAARRPRTRTAVAPALPPVRAQAAICAVPQ